ncbi:hypothetical protein AK812_SmicGene1258 [Symbiodinium microadriaticum]|uniref:Uncharacterized protein n=1 Tax=Symbiodinium microadriaticum TaxID=2951 RepID=A0A1Q9F4K8_SYMMI|nr:hypothetical protein AK812_SmicGene1258 [Symbiodinium microadriaticum]
MYMYMRLYHGRSLRTCQPWTELLAQQACWERSPDCTRRVFHSDMGQGVAAVCCCDRRPLQEGLSRRTRGLPQALAGAPSADASLKVPSSASGVAGAADPSRSSSSGSPFSNSPRGEQQAAQRVKALEASAWKVLGSCRKFPTSGLGWSLTAKERFFAVLPEGASVRSEHGRFSYAYRPAQASKSKSAASAEQLRVWRTGRTRIWALQRAL